MNGYFEEINGNNYLTLVSTNEGKEKTKMYEELSIIELWYINDVCKP